LIIPIGIVIYIILLISDGYFLTKIKWFMDIKFISISEILMYFGLFGTIFYLILSIISIFRVCPKLLVNNYCIQDNDNKTFYKFENFEAYFNEMKGNRKLILEEIVVILTGSFSFLFEYAFSLLIIKYLSPIHKIFSNPLFFFFEKILWVLINLFRKKFFIDYNSNSYIFWKFILDISGDIFYLFALIIYLEIIELKFCGFDYNTRRTISIRVDDDLNEDKKEKYFVFLQDGEVDEISLPKSSVEMPMK